MDPHTLTTFDPTTYLTLPPLTADALVTLSSALEDGVPDDASAQVELAREQLEAERKALEAAQDARRRGTSSEILAAEAELDQAVDGVWLDVRDSLRGKTAYARPGIVRLAADLDSPIDYAALVDRARRAQRLHGRLFGHEGLAFLRRKYTEQVAAMASILRIIEEDGLGEELDAVAGAGTLALLLDLQERYEAMVSARAARDRGADQIKFHVGRVRQAIVLYAVAVMGLIEAGAADSIAIVEDALRPILSFRVQALRRRGAGVEEVEEASDAEGAGGEEGEGVSDGEGAGDEGEPASSNPDDAAAE